MYTSNEFNSTLDWGCHECLTFMLNSLHRHMMKLRHPGSNHIGFLDQLYIFEPKSMADYMFRNDGVLHRDAIEGVMK